MILAAAVLAFTFCDTVTVVDGHGMRCCCPCTYTTVRVTAAGFDTLGSVDLYYEEAYKFTPKYRIWSAAVDRAAGSKASSLAPGQAATAAVSFTLPTHGALGCAAGPNLLADSLDWTLSVRVQSPAWIAMRPAMLASPEVYAAIWPVCRAEAEPRPVARGKGTPGERVYIPSSPDTITAPKWYSVTSRNGRGESCVSNVVEGR